MKIHVYLLCSVLAAASCDSTKKGQTEKKQPEVQPFKLHIEQLDPRLKSILDPAAEVEIIAEGYDWSEGPVWVNGLGLLFSDIPPNSIYKWSEQEGASLFLKPSGYTGEQERGGEVGSNGLLLDAAGKLVLCQHGDRRLARLTSSFEDPKPAYETIVDRYDGKRFNSPNDACYKSNGDLYFTDPPYGLEKRMDDPLKELDFQGVYKYATDGALTLLTDQMTRPNGIAFSPDETTLYVANSDPKKAIWMEYKLNENGEIQSERLFYDATSHVGKEKGLPDGLKVHHQGNIFATGPGGVWIFNSEGDVLGKIRTGQATSNCGFGNNGTMLYITADMYVMRVALKGVS